VLFLCSSEYKVFNIDNLRIYGINHFQYLDFFEIFLKLVNMILKQWDHYSSGAKDTVWLLIFIVASTVLLIWLHCIKIF
jgi:hypothetical protein